MKLRNGQLNSVGFSLVELSVVTLVLAIVGVGSSTVFINILKNKVSSEAKLGVIYYQDAVVETLAREVTQLAKLPDPVALSS
ncbi:MAG: prepilin-type N-terminal cleavage/methylation domain-containing protein, partial [Proteobacteria bacterium]|nr:prepilin-type N-terminal cleavage/methylation domain-containing protein [Pseudomonadota bacterium]NDD05948.1 prepilin-type N-terminal cleavage/methylation domain-containing protein [Pseudomonadota bacterium]